MQKLNAYEGVDHLPLNHQSTYLIVFEVMYQQSTGLMLATFAISHNTKLRGPQQENSEEDFRIVIVIFYQIEGKFDGGKL